MHVPRAMTKKWVGNDISRLIDRMEIDPTLAIAAVARLCEVGRNVLDSHDWFFYDYRTGKLFCVGRLVPIL